MSRYAIYNKNILEGVKGTMNICGNPECKKELPNTLKYCSKDCLIRYHELRHIKPEEKFVEEIKKARKTNKETIKTDDEQDIITENSPSFLKEPIEEPTTIDEVHEIMISLRGTNSLKDGDYRSTHLGSILGYLREKKRENKSLTLQKLALIIGMSQRQIRENYFDGLIAFEILKLSSDCSEWYWIGIKALTEQK